MALVGAFVAWAGAFVAVLLEGAVVELKVFVVVAVELMAKE